MDVQESRPTMAHQRLKPTTYNSMAKIRKRNPAFFDDGVMAHFGTVVSSAVHDLGLFITAEKPQGFADTKYTVRRAMDLYNEQTQRYTPTILNVADGFRAYDTLEAAEKALAEYQFLLRLSGRTMLERMSDLMLKRGARQPGFTALTSTSGGFTIICAEPEEVFRMQKVHNSEDIPDRALIRVDFTSETEARKALGASSSPVPAQVIGNLVTVAKGLPLGPLNVKGSKPH